MRPQNILTNIEDFDVEILSETLARFRFDLVAHPELRNVAAFQAAMVEYRAAYPNVTGYAASISGNALVLDAFGSIDPKYYGR